MRLQAQTRQTLSADTSFGGPLYMLAAAIVFTVLTLLIKLMDARLSIWHIGFFRFGGSVLLLWLVFGRQGNLYDGNNIRLLILRGCTGSMAFISAIMAIRLLPVSTALVIFFAFPAFAAVFSFIIYRERISPSGMGCIAAVMIGISILFDFNLQGTVLGQFMALVGAAFAGLTVTLIKNLRATNGPVVIYLYFCTMGTLVCLPLFVADPIWPDGVVEWAMVLGIVFSSTIGQLLMNQGFYYCRSWEGGVFMSSEVLFTAVVGIAWLGDPATWRFWLGGGLIFFSAVALNYFKTNGSKA